MLAGEIRYHKPDKQCEQTLPGKDKHQQAENNEYKGEQIAQDPKDRREQWVVALQQCATFVRSGKVIRRDADQQPGNESQGTNKDQKGHDGDPEYKLIIARDPLRKLGDLL
jgi:hypothetical protein